MAVVDGQPVNAAVTNAAYLSRTQNSDTVGKVGLNNTEPESGNAIINLQRAINKTFIAAGILSETDATSNDYTEENYILNGDAYKEAIDKLDIAANGINDLIANHIASTLAHAAEDITFFQLGFSATDAKAAIVEAWRNSIGLKGYISDSAYETANGAPIGGESYYNSTDGVIKYYDAINLEWKEAGGGINFIGVQESIGTGDGVTVDFNVSNQPLSEGGLQVYLNGILTDKSEYTFLNPTITFNNAPANETNIIAVYNTDGTPTGPIPVAGVWRVESRVISAGEESAKQLTMAYTPSIPNQVLFDVTDGVPAQKFGVDFTITGNTLDWNGYGLDGVLTAGDNIRLAYFE